MATKKEKDPTITIDGTEYSLGNLSDNAKTQIANLRYADAEIVNLQNQLAIFRTARISYAEQLKKELSAAK